MAAGVVDGHVVVQGCVHTARTQTVGDGDEAQQPEITGKGETEQSHRGEGNTDGSDLACTEASGDTVAVQTGGNGAAGNDERNDSHPGDVSTQVDMHHRPGGAQQGVRQAQADKG